MSSVTISLDDSMLRGVWCEITSPKRPCRWCRMRRGGEIYIFEGGFQELPIGCCTLTFFKDSKRVLSVDAQVKGMPWLATSFWIDHRKSAPDLPFPACRIFQGDIEMFKVSAAAVI